MIVGKLQAGSQDIMALKKERDINQMKLFFDSCWKNGQKNGKLFSLGVTSLTKLNEDCLSHLIQYSETPENPNFKNVIFGVFSTF